MGGKGRIRSSEHPGVVLRAAHVPGRWFYSVFKRIEVRPIRKMSRGKTRRANEQPPVKVVRIVPHDGVAALALATATTSAKLGLARPEGFEPPTC